MFVNIKIKSIFFIFIFSFINSQFKEYYDMSEETYYYSLPNEFPTIIQNYEKKNEVIIPDLTNKIGKIFGYLPFTEQYFFLNDNYINPNVSGSNNNIFNTQNMDDNFLIYLKKNFWTKEVEAISHYLEKNEKMLLSGLGCVKTVLQKYGYKTELNKKLYDDAYEKINNILQAQRDYITETNNFLKKIHKYIFAQRLYFLENSNYKYEDENDNFFMNYNKYNKLHEIIGKKYSSEDQKKIVKEFRDYLKQKEKYDIILNKNAMKIIMDISRMDGCKNYDDPDYNAGKSSNPVSSPEITYRHKKIVGINDISGIRNDKKTMNGYDLQHGFYLGTSEYENYRPFPYDFSNLICEFNKTITDKIPDHPLIPFLNEIYNLKIDYVNFYPNLLDYFRLNENKFKKSSLKNLSYSNNSLGNIYYIEINDTDNKIYHDLVINGKSLGNDLLIIQSCFGVFTSGGKHDKNACRDVITKECGINLDYKCKKAGFYDYINANPAVIDKSIYGEDNDKDNKKLFELFYRHFLLGGIAIRPSAFTGINLILQSYKNGKNLFKEFYEFDGDTKLSETCKNDEYDNNLNFDFSIFNNNKDNMEKIQNNEIDKSNYNLISKSNYFNFKLLRIFFTFLFLYLI